MYLLHNNLKINKIKGNGFCYLNSVRKSIFMDYGVYISMEQLTETITQYLIDNYEEFQHAHVGGIDQLVSDATDFFNDGNFDRDCVDIIVEATGHALGYRIVIFMKSPAGSIQQYVTGQLTSNRTIFLKFSSAGGNYTLGNHYDSVSHILSNFDEGPEHIEIVPESEKSTTDEPYPQVEQVIEEKNEEYIPKIPQPQGDHYVQDIEEYEMLKYLRPRTAFPHHIYDKCIPKKVKFLPSNVNGNCVYEVEATPIDYTQKTNDRRWFLMRTTTRDASVGIRKIGICKGSFICQNPSCSHLSSQQQPNEYHWEYESGHRVCYQCGQFATRLPCGAKKYVHLPGNSCVATVYHLGQHSCKLKPDAKTDALYTMKWIEKFPSLSFNVFKSTVIKHMLDLNDIDGAQEAAEKITRQAFRKSKRETVDPQEYQQHSLEAVAILKQGSDKNDHTTSIRLMTVR